jgi:branched-chain amino acid transport system ATP-binding protein
LSRSSTPYLLGHGKKDVDARDKRGHDGGDVIVSHLETPSVTADATINPCSPAAARGTSAPLLRTELLTVRFGGLTALNSVNFEVGRDEIRAIIGPNGAGKSTFFNCLTGVLRPSSGRILFKGEDITGLTADRISRKGIARSYQITNILPNATALENVRIAAQSRRHGWSMLTHHAAYGDIIAKAQAVLESVGLRGKAEELAANLSHGEQRNLEIGIALATEPELLCLDEPTAGMSAAETHDTIELVRRIAKNLTILIVEHDMQVVMKLANRITVLHYGEVLAEGTPAEIQRNPKVLEVYLKT